MRYLAPFQDLMQELWALLPNLFAMVVILGVGIALSLILRSVLLRFLRRTRFDEFAYRAGIVSALFKANLQTIPSSFVANLFYGLSLLLSFLLALSALNLESTSNVVEKLVTFFPNLIVAILVIVAGYLVCKFVGRSVLLTAVNAEVPAARLISYAVQTLIMLFAIAVGLEQIGFARTTIVAAFSILFGGLVLALALAFGLGGRDLAREFLERHMRRPNDSYSERYPFSHL